MSEFNGDKGKWESKIQYGSRLNKNALIIMSDTGAAIALIAEDGFINSKNQATANLMAAAPELLDALQEITPFAKEWINENHPVMIKAQSAIKKALDNGK